MCSLVNTCFITSIGQGEPAMTPERHVQEIRTNYLPRPPFSALNVTVRRYLNHKKGKIVDNLGSGKLPTYPSPKPTFCLKREVSVNVGLGEG